MAPIAEALLDASSSIRPCTICNNLDESDVCHICNDHTKDKTVICIVESVIDVWALENANFFNGTYHVLGGTLSTTNNVYPQDLNLEKLYERISKDNVKEVIIATNATLEGQNTAFFITEKLQKHPLKITRFAHGIPIGGELDYLDEGTISTAFSGRTSMLEQASTK